MTDAAVPTTAAVRLIALADQCVMCGICLPECPTYRIGNVEAESPRGRIALAKALVTGALSADSSADRHLDQCLGCLSCQKVCPSQVRYEDILVAARTAQIERGGSHATKPPRWLRDPQKLTRLAGIGIAVRSDRWLPPLARALMPPGSLLRRIAETQPRPPPPLHLPKSSRRNETAQRRIGLFRGCVASVHDRDTLSAMRFLLEACGHEVVEEKSTQCCGALARHHGEVAAAARSAETTHSAFASSGVDTVLVTASGCFGDLHDKVFAGSAITVADATAFLDADEAFARLVFRPLHKRVALHTPCTQANVVGANKAIARLLARIPGLDVTALPEQPRCCGAAGSYFIEHADIADRLREEKLDQAAALAPDIIVTTNVGCRLHLGNGLRQRGDAIPLRHPLALLAEQLEPAAP